MLVTTVSSCGIRRPVNGRWQDPLTVTPQVRIDSVPKPQYALRTDAYFDVGDAAPENESQQRMCDDIEFLSSAACNGREFATRGDVEAFRYIYRRMQAQGLQPRIQSFRSLDRVGHNIIGEIPGFGPEYIILMAYYDGVGNRDGTLYPGADANASGIAAMLEVARRMSEGGRYRVVVAALDGHQLSMAGAEVFARYFSGKAPKAVINIDIIGSTLSPAYRFRKDYILCLGGRQFNHELYAANNSGPDLHLTFDYYGSSNFTNLFFRKVSDHKFFLDKGVPCLMFTSGITFNTNKSADTFDTLDYGVLERRVEFITRFIRSL